MNYHYAYVYDDFLTDRKFERELAAVESKLNTFDLAGRIGRLTLFRGAKDMVEGMVHQGATTIVVVGNDATLDKVMWFLPDLDVTVGYIPIAKPNAIATLLGIPVGEAACEILSARRVETMDVGRIDDRYFLTEVSLPATVASLDIEGKYRISPTDGGSLSVRNVCGLNGEQIIAADGHDGMLEAVIVPRPTEKKGSMWKRPPAANDTRIFFRHGEILSSDPIDVHVDSHVVSGFRFHVQIVPKKLRIITGRNRRSAHAVEVLQKSAKAVTLPTATD